MSIHLVPSSRRRFLAGGVVALSGVAARRAVAQEATTDPHLWALLADPHVAPASAFRGKERRIVERSRRLVPNLEAACRGVVAFKSRPAGVLVNGDCVEFGTAEEYDLFLKSISGVVGAGVPVRLTLENHDDRPRLLLRASKAPGVEVRSEAADRIVSVVPSARANWFLLDSLTTAEGRPGTLGRSQLAWLAKALDAHSDRPALVMVHHNVNPGPEVRKRAKTILHSAAPFHPLEGGLTDTDEFLNVVLGRRHVKAVFCGHKHQLRVHRIDGVYFVFQPAVGFPFADPDATGWLTLRLLEGGAALEMHAFDARHVHHGVRLDLPWP
jgi:3',5'-cyclic-AMP phosphodiesterase